MDSDSDDDNDGPLETTSDSLDLPECLLLQRAELEMLESMFPEELKLADEEAVVVFKGKYRFLNLLYIESILSE